jgi:alkanesulfonate monooxygenase
VIGGHGQRRTPELAARFADEFNVPFASTDVLERQYRLVDEACERTGRDPGSVVRSAALVVCCGADEAEVDRRAGRIGREAAELRKNGLAGSPAEVAERLGEYRAAGAVRIYLQVLDLEDLDHLALIAAEVGPLVADVS